MYSKAMLFLDRPVAEAILLADDVRKIKLLGNRIEKFDPAMWNSNKTSIVYNGAHAKFSQNENLQMMLLATRGTTLVRANSDEHSLALSRNSWKWRNLLGEILTQLRMDLMGVY